MSRRLRRTFRKWSFPLVGWLSAVMYFVVAGGLPLPLPATGTKDVSVPFPCMDSPCGCANAEQCWTSCCCHTHAERIAWAREHGITPPRDLIVDVDTEAAAPSKSSCCTDKSSRLQKPSCCSAKQTCCSGHKYSTQASHANTTQQKDGNDVVVGISALNCHGYGTNWVTAVVAVPPTVVATVQYLAVETAFVAPPVQFSSPAYPPPVPPPRLAFS